VISERAPRGYGGGLGAGGSATASTSCSAANTSTFYTYEATGEVSAIYDAVATATAGYADPRHRLAYAYGTLGRTIAIFDPGGGTSTTARISGKRGGQEESRNDQST